MVVATAMISTMTMATAASSSAVRGASRAMMPSIISSAAAVRFIATRALLLAFSTLAALAAAVAAARSSLTRGQTLASLGLAFAMSFPTPP